MVTMLDTLEERSKKELEDIGSHEPMIYMDKNGRLVPYYLVLTSYEAKNVALKSFREMVMKEGIPRYWTVADTWVSSTRGIAPSEDVYRREMLLISEYDGITLDAKKIMLPFERRFDDNDLLKLSERIRKIDLQRGIVLPELTLSDFKDPTMRKLLSNLHPDRAWSGTIIWEQKEAFTLNMLQQPAGFTFMDRWNFYMEDTAAEVEERQEEERIANLVREIQGMDLNQYMQIIRDIWSGLISDGYEVPPIPPENDVRQILLRMAESGQLVKVEGPADLHGFAKRLEESDPRIPSDHIHSRDDE